MDEKKTEGDFLSQTNIIYGMDSAYVVAYFGSSNNKVTNVYSLGQLERHFRMNNV